jgi:demethylmenaquinone methyltransferase/2-methoxy-6-polyprenyl-1,4-benzoquinol methylase
LSLAVAASARTPEQVTKAAALAEERGFALSCDPAVGRLLASLAAAVPREGRILELGTGSGVGLAWLVHGLAGRSDVETVSVDVDEPLQQAVAALGWPLGVRFELGDGAELAGSLGRFDLVFADAPGGKLEGLDASIGALSPGGVLVVDDMDIALHETTGFADAIVGVRETLLADPALVTADLPFGSGVVLAVKRQP